MQSVYILGAALGLGVANVVGAQPVGGANLREFWTAATSRRVDVVELGDSTQLYAGFGWDEGWSQGLNDRFGLFATGILAAGENAGNGAGNGWECETFSTRSTGQYQYSGAPAQAEALCQPLFVPLGYLYVRAGSSASSIYNSGMIMTTANPLDINSQLRFHYRYALFNTPNPGTFRPVVRLEVPPFTNLSTPVSISTGGIEGEGSGFIDLPTGQRSKAIGFHWTQAGGPDIAGPFLGYWMRAERPDRTRGASISTLYAVGSRTTRDAAVALLSVNNATLRSYFLMIRSMQPSPARVLFRISFGVNDRNETLASVGPGAILPGNSQGAFEDNSRAIMAHLNQFWAAQGWDPTELFFVFTVSALISEPDDASLVRYRNATDSIAASTPRVASVRFDSLTNQAEMLRRNWYNSPQDHIHLSRSGFTALADREINALYSAASTLNMSWYTIDGGGVTASTYGTLSLGSTSGQPDAGAMQSGSMLWIGGFWAGEAVYIQCPADYNQDGGVDGADVGAFFSDWEAGLSAADVNQDGGVDGADVDAFFAAWESGGC